MWNQSHVQVAIVHFLLQEASLLMLVIANVTRQRGGCYNRLRELVIDMCCHSHCNVAFSEHVEICDYYTPVCEWSANLIPTWVSLSILKAIVNSYLLHYLDLCLCGICISFALNVDWILRGHIWPGALPSGPSRWATITGKCEQYPKACFVCQSTRDVGTALGHLADFIVLWLVRSVIKQISLI